MDYTNLTDDELSEECGRLFTLSAEVKAQLRAAAAEKTKREGAKELASSQLVQRLKNMTPEEYDALKQLIETSEKATETTVHIP